MRYTVDIPTLTDHMIAASKRGVVMESIIYVTEPVWATKRNNPFWNKGAQASTILKVAKVSCWSTSDLAAYWRGVNKRRLQQWEEEGAVGKPPEEFIPDPPSWGIPIEGTPLWRWTPKGATEERLYLRTYVKQLLWRCFVDPAKGSFVDPNRVIPRLASARDEGARQELDEPMIVRNFTLTNLRSVRFNGGVYHVK